eukprot:CAMPEP_0113561614 /NCGR_PEP_ID=MMETSP0015_2-20120614/20072_1 /TAXON_ID=2838 /ORGANISM="Odontella" /LENGTH=322 /DNA_ID=CAMNT_0000463425 /DNA_START=70 /DNA_END=1035 /DNA_ORIENTATION=- /assembly_acc=CAM_ASM_000160
MVDKTRVRKKGDATGTSVVESGSEPARPPLPLGWTKIRRKKRSRSSKDGEGGNGSSMVWCCEDPNCTDKSSLFANPAPGLASAGAVLKRTESNDDGVQPRKNVTLHGTAILLLPDVDSTWFQGHFVPSSPVHADFALGGKSKPLGLLAVNRVDMDDCLKCAEGGYREIDLTLYSFGGSGTVKSRRPRKVKFERAVCTGGDLVRLRTANGAKPGASSSLENAVNGNEAGVCFDADRVLTGRRAAPYVRQYFSSVLTRLSGGDSSPLFEGDMKVGDDDVEKVLPDCAVVMGSMQLNVPAAFVSVEASKTSVSNRPVSTDNEDGW